MVDSTYMYKQINYCLSSHPTPSESSGGISLLEDEQHSVYFFWAFVKVEWVTLVEGSSTACPEWLRFIVKTLQSSNKHARLNMLL